MPRAILGMLCPNLGTPSLFVRTPSEGEERIREESRGHRALRLVPAPSRRERRRREKQPQQQEERPRQQEATLRVYLGTPSMRCGTPYENGRMPSEKVVAPRPHK